MNIRWWSSLATVAIVLSLLRAPDGHAQSPARVRSPDGRNVVSVAVRDGKLYYEVQRDGRPLLLPSRLGIAFQGAPPLGEGLRIESTADSSADETWTQPWGEVTRVRDHHNQLRVNVAEGAAPNRKFSVVVRVFDDGIGFRYELPVQPSLGEFAISDELTEFSMADDARAWWIPSNRPRKDRSEMLYSSSPVSVI